MQFNPYGGVAAQIAANLVNAAPATTPEAIERILRTHDYRPLLPVGADQAAALARWAERLRPIFGEPDLGRQVEMLNELLATAATQPYISQHDGRPPHLHYAHEKDPLVDRLRAYTAAGLAHAVCEEPGRVGRCARADCEVAYVDTSRNGRRRFCSARCANRVHVADHRSRQGSQDR